MKWSQSRSQFNTLGTRNKTTGWSLRLYLQHHRNPCNFYHDLQDLLLLKPRASVESDFPGLPSWGNYVETPYGKIVKLWRWQIINQPQQIQPTAISVFPSKATEFMELWMSHLCHVLLKYLNNRTVRDNHNMVLVLSHKVLEQFVRQLYSEQNVVLGVDCCYNENAGHLPLALEPSAERISSRLLVRSWKYLGENVCKCLEESEKNITGG